jgi:energy-coupling factor transport system permease protein
MRSPFAYVPGPGPLQAASPAAAVAYLGSLIAVAFAYSNPIVLAATGAALIAAGLLAGARAAVRAGLWMGLVLALLIVVVNALVVSRGETVLARLGELPWLGRVDVTAEAIGAGAVLGLRATVVMIGFAVYSACVDPDRVLRALRPLAGRSALTATLISRLIPVAAADASRLRDAARLRGPAAAPVGRAPLARRLLAGSLDRAVDVAATLELRGYSLDAPRAKGRHRRSRYDARFFATGAAALLIAIAGKLLGADAFVEYPAIEVGTGPESLAVAAAIALSGLAPLRRRPRRVAISHSANSRTASNSLSAGWRI